jgi:hypothetical protein
VTAEQREYIVEVTVTERVEVRTLASSREGAERTVACGLGWISETMLDRKIKLRERRARLANREDDRRRRGA